MITQVHHFLMWGAYDFQDGCMGGGKRGVATTLHGVYNPLMGRVSIVDDPVFLCLTIRIGILL